MVDLFTERQASLEKILVSALKGKPVSLSLDLAGSKRNKHHFLVILGRYWGKDGLATAPLVFTAMPSKRFLCDFVI